MTVMKKPNSYVLYYERIPERFIAIHSLVSEE
jgi:hypothetical protein